MDNTKVYIKWIILGKKMKRFPDERYIIDHRKIISDISTLAEILVNQKRVNVVNTVKMVPCDHCVHVHLPSSD